MTFLPNFYFEKAGVGGPVTNGKILSWMIYGRTFFVCVIIVHKYKTKGKLE